MKVFFGEGIPEVFQELPHPVRIHAARIIELIAIYPEMYPVRAFGLMQGIGISTRSATISITRRPPRRFALPRFFPAAWNRRDA